MLVAFSKDIATTLRAKGVPVPKPLVAAASARGKQQLVLEYFFNHGVEMYKTPALLHAALEGRGYAKFKHNRPEP